jgi:hypothetical protein
METRQHSASSAVLPGNNSYVSGQMDKDAFIYELNNCCQGSAVQTIVGSKVESHNRIR